MFRVKNVAAIPGRIGQRLIGELVSSPPAAAALLLHLPLPSRSLYTRLSPLIQSLSLPRKVLRLRTASPTLTAVPIAPLRCTMAHPHRFLLCPLWQFERKIVVDGGRTFEHKREAMCA